MRIASFLTVLFLSSFGWAGNSVNNGGGVICVQGKCRTLVEAGLKMKPEFSGVWIPSKEHYELVNHVIDQSVRLPNAIKANIYYSVFGRGDHFRKVDVIDQTKVEKIKRQYIEVAEKAGFPIDQSTFEIVAVSSDDTTQPALTYLLPKFFELETTQQAMILIHEGLYRGRPSNDLKFVLQFESSILDIQENQPSCLGEVTRGPRFSKTCIDQQILSYQLGYYDKAQLLGGLLATAIGEKEFYTKSIGDFNSKESRAIWTVNPRKVAAFGNVDPRLPYIFSQLQRVNFRKIERKDVSQWSHDDVADLNWYEDEPKLTVKSNCSMNRDGYPYCDVYAAIIDADLKFVLPE